MSTIRMSGAFGASVEMDSTDLPWDGHEIVRVLSAKLDRGLRNKTVFTADNPYGLVPQKLGFCMGDFPHLGIGNYHLRGYGMGACCNYGHVWVRGCCRSNEKAP